MLTIKHIFILNDTGLCPKRLFLGENDSKQRTVGVVLVNHYVGGHIMCQYLWQAGTIPLPNIQRKWPCMHDIMTAPCCWLSTLEAIVSVKGKQFSLITENVLSQQDLCSSSSSYKQSVYHKVVVYCWCHGSRRGTCEIDNQQRIEDRCIGTTVSVIKGS
jgi:hypothetical protein